MVAADSASIGPASSWRRSSAVSGCVNLPSFKRRTIPIRSMSATSLTASLT